MKEAPVTVRDLVAKPLEIRQRICELAAEMHELRKLFRLSRSIHENVVIPSCPPPKSRDHK